MTNCRVCDIAALSALPQSWELDGQVCTLVQCRACGSAYTDPPPGNETLQRLYRTSFDMRWYRDHYAAKLRDSRDRIGEYRSLLGQRMLDFGGGLGYLSRAARDAGVHSTTIDPFVNPGAAEPGAWDSVVALHVLEHSNDPSATLAEMRRYLVPDGRLILAVPNYGGLGYRRLGMQWVWAQPPWIHIFHFTARGLSTLLERHGFSQLQVKYHERWDANLVADLEHAERFHRWDAAWSARRFNSIALYRRAIAAFNSRRRFASLAQAVGNPRAPREDWSELEISAVAA